MLLATERRPRRQRETLYSWVALSVASMSLVLVLELGALYHRVQLRGHYGAGSLHCKLLSFLVLASLHAADRLCGDCEKELCEDVSLTAALLSLPCFLLFHGTDCLDFIRVRCCISLPCQQPYQRLDTQHPQIYHE